MSVENRAQIAAFGASIKVSETGPTGAYEQAEHELAIIEEDIAALKYREGQTDEVESLKRIAARDEEELRREKLLTGNWENE